MLNLKHELMADITAGLQAAQAAGDLPATKQAVTVVVNRPQEETHGDYASPVALSLTKEMKVPPLEIVSKIVAHMPKKEYVGKIDAVAPGFLNIRLNPGWLTARLDNVLQQDLCDDISVGVGKSINLEFISANPTGPLTLGNARTAFSVDTLANVLSCAGFNVTREYYINDAGQQVRKLGESVIRRALQARGESVEYSEELYQGEYIAEVAQKIVEHYAEVHGTEFTVADLEDRSLIEQVGQQAADLLLADIKHMIAEDLKIAFDVWTSERALRESGTLETVVTDLKARGVLYEKEGTTFLKTTQFGDSEDRVFIKRDGEYAYIAPDVAYHVGKYQRKFDEIFTFVGADHQGHGPKLMAAMAALGLDTKRLHVIAAQWMRFVRDGQMVKLSKRRGNIVTPRDLIEEVGYDAARFFMVMHALTTHMDFDIGLAKEKSEKNPVYYVQYAYVRLQSILRRAKEEGVIEMVGEAMPLTSRAPLTHTAEVNLLRQIYLFPEVIGDIAHSYEVQRLAYYATELAKRVHVFYKHVPVLRGDSPEVQQGRLQLVLASRNVLGKTLDLLGIGKPDVM